MSESGNGFEAEAQVEGLGSPAHRRILDDLYKSSLLEHTVDEKDGSSHPIYRKKGSIYDRFDVGDKDASSSDPGERVISEERYRNSLAGIAHDAEKSQPRGGLLRRRQAPPESVTAHIGVIESNLRRMPDSAEDTSQMMQRMEHEGILKREPDHNRTLDLKRAGELYGPDYKFPSTPYDKRATASK